ncbi:MAG: heavy-metal-associated domain-containing protein [Saprospiraceae bacterium]|nr:heavy-metal-associated domain-containing protein [Saprospiraceae bacterium]
MNYSFQICLTSLLFLIGMISSQSVLADSNRSLNFDCTILKDTTRIKMYIEGMSCMRCAQKIEKKVGAIDGVKDVKVYLEEKYAIIEYEQKKPH